MDPSSTVHARVLSHRMGIANIPIGSVDLHSHHRPAESHHVVGLKEDLSNDASAKWAHPIDLVVGSNVPINWRESLQTRRLMLDPPTAGRFVCIGGQHRLLAAKMLAEEWVPTEDTPVRPPEYSSYPANIYETGKDTLSYSRVF
jgi:hypothetical protein